MDDIRKFPSVLFKSWSCRVIPSIYMHDDTLALMLKDIDDGSPIATASVNMSQDIFCSAMLSQYQNNDKALLYIKDYSENEGMLDALVQAKIVSEPITVIDTGYVEFPLVYCINDALNDEYFLQLGVRARMNEENQSWNINADG